jgi:nucleotide sugar dehydrogenase
MKIAVIGMGKIGLPLAVQYARKGHDVVGVDINSTTIDSINRGIEPFPEEAQLQEYLSEVVASRKLKATLSYEEAVSDADTIVVVVPLFVNDKAEPDFKAIDSAAENIGKHLKRKALVCFETTVPIGTTRRRFTPVLEELSELKVGKDFFVVFSPERVFTGRIFEDLKRYPKIVGGISKPCTQRGVEFYKLVLDFDDRKDLYKSNGVWDVESTESAEFVKLAETTYRDVNIGLANQFAVYADSLGVDIYEIIAAANSQSFSHIHQPGISVGGHCIPIYPQFYLWNDEGASIVRVARQANRAMPSYVVGQIEKEIGNLQGKNVLVLGVSYRPNVKESAFSGVFDLVKELGKLGASTFVTDPMYSNFEITILGLIPYLDNAPEIDAIVLHTGHSAFKQMDYSKFTRCKTLYDGRNFYADSKDTFVGILKTFGKSRVGDK